MAAPNIVNVTSIYGKTVRGVLSTSNSSYVTCPSNKVLKVNTIICANSDTANSVDVDVRFYDSSASNYSYLAREISVPAKSTLVVLSKDTSIYLEESDRIDASASNNNDADIIISYEELDDA